VSIYLHTTRRLALSLVPNLINNQFKLEQKSKSFFLFVRGLAAAAVLFFRNLSSEDLGWTESLYSSASIAENPLL